MTKLTFSKAIVQKIVEHWGVGDSALETVKALMAEGIKISMHAVYNIRRGITAQEMADELMHEQRRDIHNSPDTDTRCRWRNELLKILIPQRTESVNLNLNKSEQVKVDVNELLKQYEDLLEEAVILENASPQPVHSSQANREASSVSST